MFSVENLIIYWIQYLQGKMSTGFHVIKNLDITQTSEWKKNIWWNCPFVITIDWVLSRKEVLLHLTRNSNNSGILPKSFLHIYLLTNFQKKILKFKLTSNVIAGPFYVSVFYSISLLFKNVQIPLFLPGNSIKSLITLAKV